MMLRPLPDLMPTALSLLRRLRTWFVVWFLAQFVIGLVSLVVLLMSAARQLGMPELAGPVAIGFAVAGSGVVAAVLLWLSWATFESLLGLKRWARLALLGGGWITLALALVNLVTIPETRTALAPYLVFTPGEWTWFAALTVVARLADLGYWPWLLYVLHHDRDVRAVFTPPR
jgi:hypothetical protein